MVVWTADLTVFLRVDLSAVRWDDKWVDLKDVTTGVRLVAVRDFLLAVRSACWDCRLVERWVDLLVCYWAGRTEDLLDNLVVGQMVHSLALK